MRSAIIGAYFFDDSVRRKQFVSMTTRLTHTDPKAETAALAVAEAAACAVAQEESLFEWASSLARLSGGEEWAAICTKLKKALTTRLSVSGFAESLGLRHGVSGYAYHSVPVALYAWLRTPDNFREAMISALNCGGDTDTLGAIVGALAGACAGVGGIPSEWLDRICEWPRSTKTLTQAAQRLAQQRVGERPFGAISYFWPGLIPGNLAFLLIVFIHGLRRLVPPY